MKTLKVKFSARLPRAFTILELLVAMALFAMVAVLLVVIFEKASNIWTRAAERLEMQREAQVALETLALDLNQAGIQTPRATWIYCRMASPAEIAIDSLPLSSVRSDWLILLTRATENSQPGSGATRAVISRIAYADPLPDGTSNPIFGLYRTAISPVTTLQRIRDQKPASDYTADPLVTCDVSTLVAKNLLALQIVFEVVKDDGSLGSFVADETKAISASDIGVFQDQVRIGREIRAVQLSLTAAPKATVTKLASLTSESEKQKLLQKTGMSFTKYIPVFSRH